MDRTIAISTFPEIMIFQEEDAMDAHVSLLSNQEGISTYRLKVEANEPLSPSPITLRWKLPYRNMIGAWKSGSLHNKRQQYDWELDHLTSRISVDAPVICVFGADDSNGITFACSDATNLIEMNALYREEDGFLYCHITFFSEKHPTFQHYEADIRIDMRSIPFQEALQGIVDWWEGDQGFVPAPVPSLAKAPLYSTWYQFHQDLDQNILKEECKLAADMGFELVILDDGWQTLDSKRGYDYTGDWEPERIPNMASFVEELHELGMKVGLWFSVPFCGKKSKAYQRFKGKFLTEDHRWAPVFDPRYPEVRAHLIHIYEQAVINWKLDAFKLDFIDDFKVYPETVLTKADGRDYANVNEAVHRLLRDATDALREINPDVVIEFRQQYIGPMMRSFGNMFRAFDCPNDPVSNRIRITDVKLLCGNSAVHADPFTWHSDETVEQAALQVLNGMYGVPQLSIHLRQSSEEMLQMVRFYLQYWKDHSHILLEGEFIPHYPLANYPLLRAQKEGHTIIGVYLKDTLVHMKMDHCFDVLNATYGESVVCKYEGEPCLTQITIWNCRGQITHSEILPIQQGISEYQVPPSGMIRIIKM